MIKADLVTQIATKFDLSQNRAALITQTLLDTIITALLSGSRIELRRFGIFAIKHQAPRLITLPSGKKITVPALKTVAFIPSPNLKKKLNPTPTAKPRQPAPSKPKPRRLPIKRTLK